MQHDFPTHLSDLFLSSFLWSKDPTHPIHYSARISMTIPYFWSIGYYWGHPTATITNLLHFSHQMDLLPRIGSIPILYVTMADILSLLSPSFQYCTLFTMALSSFAWSLSCTFSIFISRQHILACILSFTLHIYALFIWIFFSKALFIPLTCSSIVSPLS